MTTTKRLLLSAAFCLSAIAANAQSNVVKLDLVSPLAISQLNLNYERMIDPRKSVNVQIGWGWGADLSNNQLIKDRIAANVTTNNPNDIKLDKFTYDGAFQIAPEFRFYFGDAEGPRGFYVAPQLNFSTYSLTARGTHLYGAGLTSNDKVNLSYTAIGGGIQLGTQWIINDKISIDWGFLGLGVVSGTVSATGTTDDAGKLASWSNDAQNFVTNNPGVKDFANFLKFTPNTTSISASGSTILPSFRSTLCIGYAF